MKIEKNKVVEFSYELEVDGTVVDHTTKERPLDYIHGTGSLLPKLEEHIEGMEPGAKFDVTLSPADGYGEVNPDMIIDLPKSAFEVNGEVREDPVSASRSKGVPTEYRTVQCLVSMTAMVSLQLL